MQGTQSHMRDLAVGPTTRYGQGSGRRGGWAPLTSSSMHNSKASKRFRYGPPPRGIFFFRKRPMNANKEAAKVSEQTPQP